MVSVERKDRWGKANECSCMLDDILRNVVRGPIHFMNPCRVAKLIYSFGFAN